MSIKTTAGTFSWCVKASSFWYKNTTLGKGHRIRKSHSKSIRKHYRKNIKISIKQNEVLVIWHQELPSLTHPRWKNKREQRLCLQGKNDGKLQSEKAVGGGGKCEGQGLKYSPTKTPGFIRKIQDTPSSLSYHHSDRGPV